MSINPIMTRTTGTAAALNGQTASSSTVDDTSEAQSAPVHISEGAKLMQRLSALATDDPEKFKEVTATISQQLGAAADQGGEGAAFLKRLSDQFASASSSGDASALQPPHREHHHHGGGQGAPATGAAAYRPHPDAAARASFEAVRQTIDGIVSGALGTE
jgi:hypothetical protein